MSSYMMSKAGKSDVPFAIGSIIILAGCSVVLAGEISCLINENEYNKQVEKINNKVATDIDSSNFSTNAIEINTTGNNLVLKISGNVTYRNGGNSNYTQAYYNLSENDYNYIKSIVSEENKAETVKELKETGKIFERTPFFENLLDILLDSEFLGTTADNIAVANDNQIVINASEPFVDETTGTLGYNVTLAKIADEKLKLATYQISTLLSADLINDPKLVYGLTKNNCKIDIIDKQTINNVNNVEIYDDYAVVL